VYNRLTLGVKQLTIEWSINIKQRGLYATHNISCNWGHFVQSRQLQFVHIPMPPRTTGQVSLLCSLRGHRPSENGISCLRCTYIMKTPKEIKRFESKQTNTEKKKIAKMAGYMG
jgi:hypothetical protein